MATKVHMEALSPTMEEGQLVTWLKGEGDAVSSGDVIAEIETDKATMELVARGDGVLRAILLQEGGTALVGEVIAIIAAEDEDISSEVAGAEVTPPGPGAESVQAEPAADPEVEIAGAPQSTPPAAEGVATSTDAGGRVKSSPLARRLAEEAGLSLGTIAGSGPGGRIVKRDVEAVMAAGPTAPATPASMGAPAIAPPLSGPDEPGVDYQDIPLSQIRKTIAKRLGQSLGPIPHFFLTIQVDMGRVLEARKSVNVMLEKDGLKVSVNDFIIRATAAALHRHPECNAHWQGDSIRRFKRVHIGVAVAVEDGLITPVVRDAHTKGVARIGMEVREMAGRAREKRLKPEEYTGSTFSISNLGMFGIQEFTAVINPPEAGILAIGRVEEVPVVEEGEVTVRPRMRITMSCDHRVIDGAQGSRFLQTLKAMLEEPAVILM